MLIVHPRAARSTRSTWSVRTAWPLPLLRVGVEMHVLRRHELWVLCSDQRGTRAFHIRPLTRHSVLVEMHRHAVRRRATHVSRRLHRSAGQLRIAGSGREHGVPHLRWHAVLRHSGLSIRSSSYCTPSSLPGSDTHMAGNLAACPTSSEEDRREARTDPRQSQPHPSDRDASSGQS